jgi:Cdc6-like AAA superfamily ATPase
MATKYNPFKPNNIVHPAMFVGRMDELRTIERCLFQAKNGNPQHFLVQGERGIGKSSLLFYVEATAQGRITAPMGNKFNFLTVSIDLGGCQSQLEIVGKVGRGLRTAIAPKQAVQEMAKDFWNWLTNWEILGVQYHKTPDELDPEQIAEELVERLSTFCADVMELDGILILIDEADRPSAAAGLGELLKLLSERLARRQCNKVVIGLAGLPNLLTRLRESHESSPRLFQTLLLEPLEHHERISAVRIGIEDANSKNSVQTTISDDALKFLADLSEGYPHFVQQFSFSAFEHDSDNVIDSDDVGDGAFKDGGALSQLGDKFFNEMYHARISSQDYRRVLDAMAEHGVNWVSRKMIIAESGVSEVNVTNALRTLKAKDIIIQDEKQRGLYRLPTNSFAAWINAIRAARAKSDVLSDLPF